MMAGNETLWRRRGRGRTSSRCEVSETSRTGGPNTATGLEEHLHHHYHNYHRLARTSDGNQEQVSLRPSASEAAPWDILGRASSNSNCHQGYMHNTNSLQNASITQGVANQETGLEERLRSSAMQTLRSGLGGSFLFNSSLLSENDEDSWSDDELLELGIEEYLAAAGLGEAMRADDVFPEQGLSKAAIRQLPRVVFVPEVSVESSEFGNSSSGQEDCSVCLEHFVIGQQLICLPCKHKFHVNCLIPWLHIHAKCPYCRAKVSFADKGASSSSQISRERMLSFLEDDLISWMEAVDSGLSQLFIR